MTALARYDLLEAEGRYLDGRRAATREVVVKFGDAALVIMGPDDLAIDHWPLATLRRIEGAGDALRLRPDHGAPERLTIDDPVMIEALREVCPGLDAAAPAPRARRRRLALLAAAAIGSIALLVTVIVPALAARLAEQIPPEAEIAMGDRTSEQILKLLELTGEPARWCEARSGQAALDALTARLGAKAHVPIRVRVVDHSMINAFAAPGGRIVIFRGLIDAAESPEEVAGVLAHEIGHVIHRDPTREALRAAGAAGLLGLLIGDFTGAGASVALGEALLNATYRQDAETRADAEAARLLDAADLPSTPFARFFERMREMHGDTPQLLSHVMSHPDSMERAAAARAADRFDGAEFAPALDDQRWLALRRICD